MKNTFIALLLYIISIVFCGCTHKTYKLFYIKAELIDIKRDDDGQYHLLVRFKDGETISINDNSHCKIKMGNYNARVDMPYVRWEDEDNNYGAFSVWNTVSEKYSYEDIIVYLPIDYKINLFTD